MSRELPKDRLATTDEAGKRVYLFPAAVRGLWKTRRNYVHSFLVVLFLVLPWLRIGETPVLLFDIAHRKFVFFGVLFSSHDTPLLFFLLSGFAVMIALLTAVFGRVWCGWTCPQTVYIEGVFRRIEAWIEGDHLAQRRLHEGPWTSEKVLKRGLKWSLFVVVGLVISHSFLAYFVGTDELRSMMLQSPKEHWGSFLFMLGFAGILILDFGWFREQFCVIACPYGRFQSVLMDSGSKMVGYDVRRGEPRRGAIRDVSMPQERAASGDCIDCFKCVQVCPTGIDIRRGLQMECIACTACVDACDSVMEKIGRPLGLIRYGTLQDFSAEAPSAEPSQFRRARTWVYLGVLSVILGGLVVRLALRAPVEIFMIRAIETPYRLMQVNGESLVLNHYKVQLHNVEGHGMKIAYQVDHPQVRWVSPRQEILLPSGNSDREEVFFQFPKEILAFGKTEVHVTFRIWKDGDPSEAATEVVKDVQLVGPLR